MNTGETPSRTDGTAQADADAALRLVDQQVGTYRCVDVEGDDASVRRLKRLGVCFGQRVELVQAGDPMILRVAGSRLGVSRHLASRVRVESHSAASTVSDDGAGSDEGAGHS